MPDQREIARWAMSSDMTPGPSQLAPTPVPLPMSAWRRLIRRIAR
jgi:hypothetical protein